MNSQEIESLLRRATPRGIPFGWKEEILSAAQVGILTDNSRRQFSGPVRKSLLPRLTWAAVAACWGVIFFLHATTPALPQGTLLFDPVAYAQRDTLIQRLASIEQEDLSYEETSRHKTSPPRDSPPSEFIFRLRAPRVPHLSPSTPRA